MSGVSWVLAATLAGSPCRAAVLDIAPDGQVTVIDGPSVQLSTDPRQALRIGGPAKPRIAAPGPARATAAKADVQAAIQSASRSEGLGRDLVEAVAWQESRFRPNAVSPKGARGVMQLMPATAKALRVQPDDVNANIRGGAAYLRALLTRYDGDLTKTLAAYNAGPLAVDRHGGVPPYRETQAYVAAVLERLAAQVAPPSFASTRFAR